MMIVRVRKVNSQSTQKARGFWNATPGGPGWASTQYYMQKLVDVQFCRLKWFYSVKWEDVDPFGSRPSFKLFLTIYEHRF
jgi:hypothetical protein